MADAVRVGLDRFVLDALGSESLEERAESGNRERDPAAPARAAFGSMMSQACSSISQSTSSPTRLSGGRPKNRVYQSMLASRSDTGTPAKRWVIALIPGR